MEAVARIEACLETAIEMATTNPCPPKLASAVHYSVFPGGARVRPLLTLSVAAACSCKDDEVAEGAAAAIEMLHCASLVHDDLPCFDDADLRRGHPSVHKLHGQPLALLAGDALIVEAFNTITRACANRPERLAPLLTTIAGSVGMLGGIIAGQAWESESNINISEYHRAKTGSLFDGAVTSGAKAAGSDPLLWRPLGEQIGEAYQIADDLMDAVGSVKESGKPVEQDTNLSRPNAVSRYGLNGAMNRLKKIVNGAAESIPECEGSDELRELIIAQATRLVPAKLAKNAA